MQQLITTMQFVFVMDSSFVLAKQGKLMIKELFVEHPLSLGETYWQHAKVAFTISWGGLKMCIMAFIHGVFPFLFVHGASNQFKRLQKIIEQRDKKTDTG